MVYIYISECGDNEYWDDRAVCDATCKSPFFCYYDDPGCACLPGYVRHKGVCIEIELCPEECSEGEVWSEFPQCERQCGFRINNEICDYTNEEDCYCIEDGYVRDPDGYCIPYEECGMK